MPNEPTPTVAMEEPAIVKEVRASVERTGLPPIRDYQRGEWEGLVRWLDRSATPVPSERERELEHFKATHENGCPRRSAIRAAETEATGQRALRQIAEMQTKEVEAERDRLKERVAEYEKELQRVSRDDGFTRAQPDCHQETPPNQPGTWCTVCGAFSAFGSPWQYPKLYFRPARWAAPPGHTDGTHGSIPRVGPRPLEDVIDEFQRAAPNAFEHFDGTVESLTCDTCGHANHGSSPYSDTTKGRYVCACKGTTTTPGLPDSVDAVHRETAGPTPPGEGDTISTQLEEAGRSDRKSLAEEVRGLVTQRLPSRAYTQAEAALAKVDALISILEERLAQPPPTR